MLLNIAGRGGKQTRRVWGRIRAPFSREQHPGGEDSAISKRKTPRRDWGGTQASPGLRIRVGSLEGERILSSRSEPGPPSIPGGKGGAAPGHCPGRVSGSPAATSPCHLQGGEVTEPPRQEQRDAEHRDVPAGTALPKTPGARRSLVLQNPLPRDRESSPTCKSSFSCWEARSVPTEKGKSHRAAGRPGSQHFTNFISTVNPAQKLRVPPFPTQSRGSGQALTNAVRNPRCEQSRLCSL